MDGDEIRAQTPEALARESLLKAVDERVRGFAESGVARLVLEESATSQLQQMEELVSGAPEFDLEAYVALGTLHWCRFLALPEDEGQADMGAAYYFFTAIARIAPLGAPKLARRYLSEDGSAFGFVASWISQQAIGAFREFEHAGDAGALDSAVHLLGLAMDITPARDPLRAARLSNFGVALAARFELTGRTYDIDMAIAVGRAAVDATLAADSDRALYLSSLGAALRARFERTGQLADLDAAIVAGQQAVDVVPSGHPGRGGMLSNFASALERRFERTGQAADLDAAIAIVRQAADVTPAADTDRAGILSNLGLALLRRFELTGQVADLDAGIIAGRQAVDAGGPGIPGYLSNLALAQLRRFELTGQVTDLDASITAGRQAVDATPAGHPDRAMYLSNLGGALRIRFEQTRQAGDLSAAISAGQQAVDIAPADHPDRAWMLSNLGAALQRRLERTGQSSDLDAAISVGQAAVDAAPAGHPSRSAYLSNLGSALKERFERTGRAGDLEAAVTATQAAVDTTPAGHPSRAVMLSNLGNVLRSRFERTGQDSDLQAAITAGQAAVDATPADHPDRARHLSNLGTSLGARFGRTGQAGDLDAAVRCWRAAVAVDTAPAGVRLTAARLWGEQAFAAGDVGSAADGYAAGVRLLPQAAWHGLDRATQEYELAGYADLAPDGAACAAAAGQLHRAVEVLEQGRSVLWTQALHLRSDLTSLRERAPELAGRLDAVRRELDRPLRVGSVEASGTGALTAGSQEAQEHALEDRRRLARQWDDLLAQVRLLDGFEHFLQPIPFSELRAASADGPVVIVNASPLGCHALIITLAGDAGVQLVALPDLTYQEAADRANALLDVLSRAGRAGRPFLEVEADQHAVFDVLDWLWRVIAAPVLDALGHTGLPVAGSAGPRLWWCPTGPLAVLPLHAAGCYSRTVNVPTRPEKTVPGWVVSSYASSVTGLLRARQAPVLTAGVRQLVVAMPDTPGQTPLPAVPAELDVLAGYFPPPALGRHLVAGGATRAAVLGALADYPWLHLACHAYQDPDDSARSAFDLWDGPLTVADLAASRTGPAELAFLSACQTAAGDSRLPDEAIHLAAAMQLLGYRHVIATLWTIADSPAPYVADAVYARLTGTGTADASRAARALHYAVGALRAARPVSPLIWAPYIHIGV